MASQRDLATNLLQVARDDRAAAATLLRAGSAPLIVGFHCQQAVEKALKAVLAVQGVEFPYTHDLALLIQLCHDAGAVLPASLGNVDRLTPFAVQVRYGTTQSPEVDLRTALSWVDQVMEWSGARVDISAGSDRRG